MGSSNQRLVDADRYGGKEFCVLLHKTNAGRALLFAQRLRQLIELRFTSGAMPGFTASFGVAEFSVWPHDVVPLRHLPQVQGVYNERIRNSFSS